MFSSFYRLSFHFFIGEMTTSDEESIKDRESFMGTMTIMDAMTTMTTFSLLRSSKFGSVEIVPYLCKA